MLRLRTQVRKRKSRTLVSTDRLKWAPGRTDQIGNRHVQDNSLLNEAFEIPDENDETTQSTTLARKECGFLLKDPKSGQLFLSYEPKPIKQLDSFIQWFRSLEKSFHDNSAQYGFIQLKGNIIQPAPGCWLLEDHNIGRIDKI